MIDAFIGIGSNLGDRLANLAAAVREIGALPVTRLVAVSHAYESEPWGMEGQDTFYNAVVRIATDAYADQLLAMLKDAEERLGRKPTNRFGPRIIDLDILLFGDEEWDSDRLTIPHPRMRERDFVITPLLEVAPEATFPDGVPVAADAGARLGRVLGLVGAIPGFEDITPERAVRKQRTPTEARPDAGAPDMGRTNASSDFRVPGRGESFHTAAGEEWVPLGLARLDPSPSIPELIFYDAVLADADIPHRYYPQAPGESGYGPYGIPRYIDIYVPLEREREARAVIDRARRAPADES